MSNLCECGCMGIPSDGKRYISGHNAKGKERKPRIKKTCIFCSGEFFGTKANIEKRIYCSKECRDGHRKILVGKLSPSYTSIELTCMICGKVFTIQPARQKNHQVYCSMDCGREGRRIKISGKARKTRPFGKQKAKVRDQFKCKICGFDLVVHAHHIIPRKDGGSNRLDNLITLCPNHHAMAHAGLVSIKEMQDAIKNTPLETKDFRVKAKNALNFRAPICCDDQ